MSTPSHPQPTAAEVEAAKERLTLYVAQDVPPEYMLRENEILTNLDDDIRTLLSALSRSVSDGEDGKRLDFIERYDLEITSPWRQGRPFGDWRVYTPQGDGLGQGKDIRAAIDAARTPTRGGDHA